MTTTTTTKTILITGSNRGLGRLLLSSYLQRPNLTVIAAVRNPSHPTSQSLLTLPVHPSGTTRLIVVKLDLNVPTDPAAAVQELAEKHNIDTIDVVIANASVGWAWPRVREAEVDDIRAHMETNVFGFVELAKALLPVLERTALAKNEKDKGRGEDKEVVWITIGSGGGLNVSSSVFDIFFSFFSVFLFPLLSYPLMPPKFCTWVRVTTGKKFQGKGDGAEELLWKKWKGQGQ